jgi:hypothetical protein
MAWKITFNNSGNLFCPLNDTHQSWKPENYICRGKRLTTYFQTTEFLELDNNENKPVQFPCSHPNTGDVTKGLIILLSLFSIPLFLRHTHTDQY